MPLQSGPTPQCLESSVLIGAHVHQKVNQTAQSPVN